MAADLPASLKPGDPNIFFSTDRAGAEKIVNAFKENAAADKQINGDNVDWILIGEAIFSGLIAGIVIDRTVLK